MILAAAAVRCGSPLRWRAASCGRRWCPGWRSTTRVLYFHIPSAWITVLALGWSMVHSVALPAAAADRARRPRGGGGRAGPAVLHRGHGVRRAVGQGDVGRVLELGPARDLYLLPAARLRRVPGAAWQHRGGRTTGPAVGHLLGGRVRDRAVPDLRRTAAVRDAAPGADHAAAGEVDMDPWIRIGFFAMLAGFTVLFFWLQKSPARARSHRDGSRAAFAAGTSG